MVAQRGNFVKKGGPPSPIFSSEPSPRHTYPDRMTLCAPRFRPACFYLVSVQWPMLVILGLAIAALSLSPAQGAEEQKKNYNLSAGDAVASLKQFEEQSGAQIIYMVGNLRGKKTNAVSGWLNVRDVLDRMLAGTGLVAMQDKSTGAFVIARQKPNGNQSPSTPSGVTSQDSIKKKLT